MAYRVIVMPVAWVDLDKYTTYIAQDSKRYAVEWLNKAWDLIFSLAENPKRFSVIDEAEEIGVELRDVIHYSHRIVYRVNETAQVVEVLRVYHGARKSLTAKDVR